MSKYFIFAFFTIYLDLWCNLQSVYGSRKSWNLKSVKKVSKSEVDVKTYVFPCSIDDEKFLNYTFGSNHKHLRNCKRKLVVKMTVNSGGKYCSKSDGFIPIDHVVDGISGRKKRLLNPLMIRIKREKMYQLYNLQLVKTINAEAKEEVLNYENTENFSGCDTSSSHPTCGFSFFNNKIIQFSEGFCCSCDQVKNDQRQPCEGHLSDSKNLQDMTRYSIRQSRSNRSSRDLETVEVKQMISSNNSDHEALTNNKQNDELMSFGLAKTEKIENGMFNNNIPLFNKNDDSNVYIVNVTTKSFQMKYSPAPQNANDNHGYNSKFNTAIQNEDNLPYSMRKPPQNSDIQNLLSQEKIKLLMMHKIKQDKNDEKMSSTMRTESLPMSTKIEIYKASPLNNQSQIENNAAELLSNDSEKDISFILTNGHNDLDFQTVSEKPKEISSFKTLLKVPVSSQLTENDSLIPSDKNVKFVQNSFKDVVRLVPTHTPVSCENSNSSLKNNVKPSAVENKTDLPEGFKSLENIVYKVMPLINSEHFCSQYGKQGNTSTVLIYSVNNTHNISSENKSLNLPQYLKIPDPGIETIMNMPADSLTFSLESEPLPNNTISVKDLQSQNSMVSETPNNPKSEPRKEMVNLEKSPSTLMIGEAKQKVEKREVEGCDRQIRGGQSCTPEEKELPCNADAETYLESAHCLRFSDLWYNVHKLFNPRMENAITIKIFAKHKTADKKICWENLTKRLPGRVGTVNEVLTDDERTVVISYSSDDKVAFSLDCASDYVLVPQPISKHCKSPELKKLASGGPGEYLVLKESEITFDGEDCDKAGVTFATFARQPHRCQHKAGSCLKNQPLQLWREDKKAAAKGKPGQYFLNNYVTVSEQAIMQNVTSNQVVLKAPYYELYQSHVIVEIIADHIDIIADRSEGQITEVYTDATSDKITIVKVVVTNMGIAADYFGVDFANCSSPLGPSDFDKPGRDEIPPQHRMTYTATITSPLVNKRIDCKLVLYNMDQDKVAVRHIIIVRGQRCMCVWYCKCVCYNYPDAGLPCIPLSVKEYNRAGFLGQPLVTGSVCSILFSVFQGLLWFFLFLLLLGLIKAVLGLCISIIGVWGMWYILPEEARCLCCYMEPHLACTPIVRDCAGFPVDPHSNKRTVHFLPWYSEFSLNLFFFICVARTCLCDGLSRRASYLIYPNQQYQPMGCSRRMRQCSPACSARRGANSPCGSVCSQRRRYRLSAGAESCNLEANAHMNADDDVAQRLVDKLLSSYLVYRCLTRPLGGVHSVPGTPYCVQGFFVETEKGVFEFSPTSPLLQIWHLDQTPLEAPLKLNATPFHTKYHSPEEVLAAHELASKPRGVVINAP